LARKAVADRDGKRIALDLEPKLLAKTRGFPSHGREIYPSGSRLRLALRR